MCSYQVKQGDLFGRIGSGFAEGLAGQLPKEVERNRLAASLEEIGTNPDLNQFQQFARLASAPGSTPQIQQSGAEILKQMAIRQGYKNANQQYRDQGGPGQSQGPQPNLNDIVFGQQPGQSQRPPSAQNQQQIDQNQSKQMIPTDFASRSAEVAANPPAAKENPLAQKFMPPPAWNQQMHEREMNNAFERGIARTFDEANAYANQQKQFYEDAPVAERAKLNYQKEIDEETDNLFTKQLSERLEKEGKDVNSDIPGTLKLDIQKKARNDVATGKRTPQEAAEYYSKAALDLAETRSKALELANRDDWDRISPEKKTENLKKLATMADSYARMGADKFFFNMLQDKGRNPDGSQKGFGLSPGAAALIQYPRSEATRKIIDSAKFGVGVNKVENTNRFADDVLHNMSSNDSILAIAKEMRDKYPHNFDEVAYFDYIRDHPELWRYNPRLEGEVQKGVGDLFPNWGDLELFPFTGQSPVHNRVRK